MFLLDFAILIYSIILHEIAHGFVADKLGDPTARVHKRLTLNPIPHIDPLMTIIMPVILFLAHSPVIFGAAKPVPVDLYNFKDPKRDGAITALAGPVTNLLIAGALSIPLHFIPASPLSTTLATGIIMNVNLAIFNLFPLPPLDGSKVLAGVLPDNLASQIHALDRFGFVIIFLVLFAAPGLIFGITGPLAASIISVLIP